MIERSIARGISSRLSQTPSIIGRPGLRPYSQATISTPTMPVIAKPPPAPTRRPVGAFRGGITGFLLGTSIAAAVGWYYLLEEYNAASDVLLSSVEDLQQSTSKVANYVRRIEEVEGRLSRLEAAVSRKGDIDSLRQEFKQVFVSNNTKSSFS